MPEPAWAELIAETGFPIVASGPLNWDLRCPQILGLFNAKSPRDLQAAIHEGHRAAR